MAILLGAVEGLADEAALKRLVEDSGAQLGAVYGKRGKPNLVYRLRGYNSAARFSPWVVLIDLDRDADCAPTYRSNLLPNPAPQLCLRIVVRALEAWLIADRANLAKFLGVRISRVPIYPETLDDPKKVLIDLAHNSRKRAIR